MKDILKKFTSRKFVTALCGIVIGVVVAFGYNASDIQTVAGAATSLISLVTYIIAEGKIDANRVKETIEDVQDAVETIQKEGE